MKNFLLNGEVKDLAGIAGKFNELMKQIIGPVIAVIGVAAVIYAVVLGFNYAKAEDAEARKKVQGRLIGALIGAVIIVAGAVLCFAIKWDSIYTSLAGGNSGAPTIIKAFLNM